MARVEIDESGSSDTSNSSDRVPAPVDPGEASSRRSSSDPEKKEKTPSRRSNREEKIRKLRTADGTKSTLTEEALLPLLNYPECRKVKIYPTKPKD